MKRLYTGVPQSEKFENPCQRHYHALKCIAPDCNGMMSHSGIYTKAREVIDFQSRYYMVGGDYPQCRECKSLVCPFHVDLLNLLDPSQRQLFPAVLSTRLALDRSCVTLMKPRTLGNSSSYAHQVLQETHSEEWAKRCILYLEACKMYKKSCLLLGVGLLNQSAKAT